VELPGIEPGSSNLFLGAIYNHLAVFPAVRGEIGYAVRPIHHQFFAEIGNRIAGTLGW